MGMAPVDDSIVQRCVGSQEAAALQGAEALLAQRGASAGMGSFSGQNDDGIGHQFTFIPEIFTHFDGNETLTVVEDEESRAGSARCFGSTS